MIRLCPYCGADLIARAYGSCGRWDCPDCNYFEYLRQENIIDWQKAVAKGGKQR